MKFDEEGNEIPVIVCKGCQKEDDISDWGNLRDAHKYHEWVRSDAHGIYTGVYCEHCYEHNYPYRKDKYPTMETDGYGDYLGEDY